MLIAVAGRAGRRIHLWDRAWNQYACRKHDGGVPVPVVIFDWTDSAPPSVEKVGHGALSLCKMCFPTTVPVPTAKA